MSKNRIKINENQLRQIVSNAVKNALNENSDMSFRINAISALENMLEYTSPIEILTKLGNEIGWRQMAIAIQKAFSGDNEAYTKQQEMRPPFGV